MILLSVWLTLPDGEQVMVGDLACGDSDAAGAFASEFEYAPQWLADPRGFPLDPISLPLRRGRFAANNLEPPLGVFDDALPDDWGRALIARERKLPRGQQGAPFLLREMAAQHGPSIGSLLFVEGRGPPTSKPPAATIDLTALAVSAEAFEDGLAGDPEGLQRLFAAGSSVGGARPKVLVSDGTRQWIAKFASIKRDGRFDVVGLEAVGLDLAAESGLCVPTHELCNLGNTQRRALLVERFDVVAEQGRCHMISLHTLCRERPGAYVQSYSELADAVRQVSAAPQHDIDKLFRQMVFNSGFGNTDDHLKNFWMVRCKGGGYRLSPAFDLLPDVGERREHALAFEYDHGSATRTEMLAVAKQWGVQGAGKIVDDVVFGISNFAVRANGHSIPETNIIEIGADIDRRLRRLQSA